MLVSVKPRSVMENRLFQSCSVAKEEQMVGTEAHAYLRLLISTLGQGFDCCHFGALNQNFNRILFPRHKTSQHLRHENGMKHIEDHRAHADV